MIQSKFDPLKQYLEKSGQQSFILSFAEIEDILQEKLCNSAGRYKVYWSPSRTHTCALAIQEAGYKVEKADLKNKNILLSKVD